MKVPFTLHKTDRPASASAVLLLSENVADLLALCARIAEQVPEVAREWPALPPIHVVPGGFLVKLGRSVSAVFPGTIRLRGLAANLFIPSDAELVPTLLDDEAAGLVRERGLIFLPGGRVLAFDYGRLLTADSVLTLSQQPARSWRALPVRPPRPDRLREIRLDLPDDSPAAILETGGANIGVEPIRPADAGPAAKAAGRTAMGAGRGLMWLGKLLRSPGLAKLGASLAAGAMKYVPRLSESLLGQQEAALRELLRRFREGNLDDALRHALPLTNSPARGARPAPNAQLPTHSLFYRLSDLLGSRGGAATVWTSPDDVHAELVRQYRKAAEAATARGDYRRAAFIYGKLLQDYRLAADVLARGGLHHDAAILYLELLRDTLAAARAFEAAGEIDRALELYCQRGEHVQAGDLLRRAGEDEEAVRHYLLAADQHVTADNHLAAANLLFERAQRPDLAVRYLADGWARRPRGSSIACLLKLTQWHAEQDGQRELLALVTQAEAFFAPPGNESNAGQFFNALANLADRPNLSALREDLRDRALCGLADKLRPHAHLDHRPGLTVSALFGQSGAWKPALVSDADFALKSALKKKGNTPPAPKRDIFLRPRVHIGVVSAVCAAPISGRVFLGFVDGTIACFDPAFNPLATCFRERAKGPVISLATDDRGQRLVALVKDPPESTHFLSLGWTGTDFQMRQRRAGPAAGSSWLTPIAEHDGHTIVGIWEGDSLAILWSDDLVPWLRSEVGKLGTAAQTGLLSWPDGESMSGCLFCGDVAWCFKATHLLNGKLLHFGWRPGSQLRGLCSAPPLSRLWRDWQHLEIVGIDEDDSIHWTELDYSHPEGVVLGGGASNAEWKYLAAVLLAPGRLAGVTREGVVWLRREGHRLQSGGPMTMMTMVSLENAVACAVSLPARELLVICRDGVVVRVPLPN